MTSFKPKKTKCPSCGRTGDCNSFAKYNRYVVDFIKGKPVSSTIEIVRVKCSCGCTHAILPDPIIPYDSYSLFFILRVLTEYAMKRYTVSNLCDRFGISPSTLYRWKDLYKKHRLEWQGLLKTLEQTFFASLVELAFIAPYSSHALSFLQKTGMSFLQSHKNPTHLPRSKSPPDFNCP